MKQTKMLGNLLEACTISDSCQFSSVSDIQAKDIHCFTIKVLQQQQQNHGSKSSILKHYKQIYEMHRMTNKTRQFKHIHTMWQRIMCVLNLNVLRVVVIWNVNRSYMCICNGFINRYSHFDVRLLCINVPCANEYIQTYAKHQSICLTQNVNEVREQEKENKVPKIYSRKLNPLH